MFQSRDSRKWQRQHLNQWSEPGSGVGCCHCGLYLSLTRGGQGLSSLKGHGFSTRALGLDEGPGCALGQTAALILTCLWAVSESRETWADRQKPWQL